jgi:signal transduction histidine kinase
MVVVDEEGQIVASRYVEEEQLTPEFVRSLAQVHEPILIEVGSKDSPETQSVYYGESNLVVTLRYYPYIQFGFILLLIGIGYTSYRSIVNSEQSNLWVGMTKEAAHQLGTPLSGMYGWIELLKDRISSSDESRKKELEILAELEQDVQRLSTIADRFNKIGSTPELRPTPLKEHLAQSVEYMRRRLPKTGTQVELNFSESLAEKFLNPSLNPVLFQWVVENLIKNAADATASKIELLVSHDPNHLLIDVIDNGSGIEKKYWDEMFRPGYSTKKRGWGLGLTLTKRIVEQYHGGKIGVMRSELGKGTTIRISLPVQ